MNKKFIIFLLVLFLIPAANALETSFVHAYYNLSSANDASGNGRTLTSSGVTYGTTQSLIGESGEWDAADYLNYNPGILIPTTEDFSFSYWVYPDNAGGDTRQILFGGVSGATCDKGFTFALRSNGSLYMEEGCNAVDFQDALISFNEWTHLVVVYNKTGSNSKLDLYINGVYNDTITDMGSYGDLIYASDSGSPTDDRMGTLRNGAATQEFEGYMDEISIWNTSLTAENVTELYNSGAGCAWPLDSCVAVADPQIVQTEDVSEKDFDQDVIVNNVNYQNVATINFTLSEEETTYLQTKIIHVGSASNELTCRMEIDGNYYDTEKSRTQSSGETGTLTLLSEPLNLTSGDYQTFIQCKRVGGGQITITDIQENNHGWNSSINYTYAKFNTLLSSSVLTQVANYTLETGNYSENQIVLDYVASFKNLDTTSDQYKILFEIAGNNCSINKRDTAASSSASIKGGCVVQNLQNLTSYDIKIYSAANNGNATVKFYAKSLALNSSEIDNLTILNQNVSTDEFTKIANFSIENINFNNEDILVAYYFNTNASTTGDVSFYINITGTGNFGGDILNVSVSTGLRSSFIKEVFTSVNTGTYQVELYAACGNSDCNIEKGNLIAYMAGDIPLAESTGFDVFAFDVFTNATINIFNLTTSENLTFFTENGVVNLPTVLEIENFSVKADGYAFTTQLTNTTGLKNTSIYLYTSNSFDIIFKDEESLETINNVTLELISDVFSNNYTTTNGTIYVDLLTPVEYTLRYSSDGYDERLYYISLGDRTYNNLTLYLLNSSSSTTVTATVYDQTNKKVEDVYIKVLRYDLASNSYQIKEVKRTNFDGETTLNLVLNDEFYKFILEKPLGTVIYTSSSTQVFESSITFQVLLGEQAATTFFNYVGVSSDLTFNNDTDTFSYTYSDSSGMASQSCIEVYQFAISQDSLLYSECITGSAGSTTHTLSSPGNGTTYYAKSYVYFDSEEYFLEQVSYTYPSPGLDFGSLGLFLTLLMLLGVIGIWMGNIQYFMIMGPLILIVARFMGIFDISYGILIPLQIVAVGLSAVLGKR